MGGGLKDKINITDLGVEVYEKIEQVDLKEVAVYIEYLHNTIKSYNLALSQLNEHLPETAK